MTYSNLYSVFIALGDFFGRLSVCAGITTQDFLRVVNYSVDFNAYYVNIVTGLTTPFTISSSFLTDVLSPFINIFSWLLPEFTFSLPLWLGLLLGASEWFLLIAVIKFFKGLF